MYGQEGDRVSGIVIEEWFKGERLKVATLQPHNFADDTITAEVPLNKQLDRGWEVTAEFKAGRWVVIGTGNR